MEIKEDITARTFAFLLNRINSGLGDSLLTEEDVFRLQVLLIHCYLDYLLTSIIKTKFPFLKRVIRDNTPVMTKLKLVSDAGILDEDGFNALSVLNDIRNHLAHRFRLDMASLAFMINHLRERIDGEFREMFDRLTLLERLELSCFLYINSLREYLYRLHGGMPPDILGFRIERNRLSFFYTVIAQKKR